MTYGCDAHFENGVAVCSCSESERFNSAPRDDECEVCQRTLATREVETLPPTGTTVKMCESCYETAAAEIQRMLDEGCVF